LNVPLDPTLRIVEHETVIHESEFLDPMLEPQFFENLQTVRRNVEERSAEIARRRASVIDGAPNPRSTESQAERWTSDADADDEDSARIRAATIER
jgi:hypothetical protein